MVIQQIGNKDIAVQEKSVCQNKSDPTKTCKFRYYLSKARKVTKISQTNFENCQTKDKTAH